MTDHIRAHYKHGRASNKNGRPRSKCPYEPDTTRGKEWLAGWDDFERAREVGLEGISGLLKELGYKGSYLGLSNALCDIREGNLRRKEP